MLNVGPYHVSSVETGTFGLDGGAMFGIVPRPLWEKTNPPDEKNRIHMHARAMLIQRENPRQNILVDCGNGSNFAEKYRAIYKIDERQFSLASSLKEKGLSPTDITHYVGTHLHFDHAGGLTHKQNNDIVPTFPNAQVFLQRRNWELAWHPSEKDQASYLSVNYSPYKDDASFARKLTLVDTPHADPNSQPRPRMQEEEILPGVFVRVSSGHTLGMQVVHVKDPEGRDPVNILYCADLVPTSTHVPVPWIMAYDCYPMFIMEEKKLLLARAYEEKTALFYEHCPHMSASQIEKGKKGFHAGAPLAI